MIERGLQWRYLHRNPLVRQHFPYNFRRRRKYYNFGQRPLRNQLMFAQSEDFIDRNTEYTNNFYINHQRVPYYSGRYSPHNRQNFPERKRRFHHSLSRLAASARPRHYDHQDYRHPQPSPNSYWGNEYQLREYFYYGYEHFIETNIDIFVERTSLKR